MKSKHVCYAAAVALGLAVLGTVPAWSQSLIGDAVAAGEDPYASSYGARHAEGVDKTAAAHHAGRRQRHF